jgi:hypothetical protein
LQALIFSASRRTDIPAFFGEWLLERLRRGELAVRNPMNNRQVTHFKFDPGSIDCIVFWTKNPAAFMKRLHEIDELGYKYYFQFTITPYGTDIEQHIDKEHILDTFIRLSEKTGRHRVIWRYDPIIINERYSVGFHADQFGKMAEKLCNYTEKCVISFVDEYTFLSDSLRKYGIAELTPLQIESLAGQISRTLHALSSTITLSTCCEKAELGTYGIRHNRCIDGELIAQITGVQKNYGKDPSQRPECGCIPSRDIGTYNTCPHGCVYCYAGRGTKKDAGACNRDSLVLCDTIDTARDTVRVVDLRQG